MQSHLHTSLDIPGTAEMIALAFGYILSKSQPGSHKSRHARRIVEVLVGARCWQMSSDHRHLHIVLRSVIAVIASRRPA